MPDDKQASDSQEKDVYTKDEVNKMIEEAVKAPKEELGKLKKIFDERQTKTLDKEGILKILGVEKDPTKDPLELINEKMTSFNSTIEQLQKDLKDKDEKLLLKEKQATARKAAEKFNFHDIEDVMKFVNLDAENLEDEFKNVADSKPYLVKQKTDIPTGNPVNSGNIPKDIDQQIADAVKKGDFALSIALKNKKAGLTT